MHDRPAKYADNHDGDTVTMMLDQDFFDTKTINIRLANVWAPETDQDGGLEVQAFVAHWFKLRARGGGKWPFVVHTMQTRNDTEVLSFNRFVATVMTADGKHSLNSEVMEFITDRGYGGGIGSIARPAAEKS
jgi:endonuclease YncB( thermonuclease family)